MPPSIDSSMAIWRLADETAVDGRSARTGMSSSESVSGLVNMLLRRPREACEPKTMGVMDMLGWTREGREEVMARESRSERARASERTRG